MGIFSKLFGTKDSTPEMKNYSFIADIAAFFLRTMTATAMNLLLQVLTFTKRYLRKLKTTDIPLLLYRRSYQWQKFR